VTENSPVLTVSTKASTAACWPSEKILLANAGSGVSATAPGSIASGTSVPSSIRLSMTDIPTPAKSDKARFE
jgi:hypothetical protein